MKTFQHTLLKLLPLTVSVVALLAVNSCSRDEGATRGGGCRELTVNVQMQNSDWQTRSGGGSVAEGTHDRTQVLGSAALDEQLEVVTECEPIGYTPDAPLTRGTPVGSASELQSMGFAVYTNSAFTKNCTATYAGGSWVIANNIGLDVDNNKYSYYAYAPVVAADNGIVLQADGQKLTYTAPDDITRQPDLCRAAHLDDQTGTVTFAMRHALTAVGIKVRADNVEIKSIKLLGVNTSGTLDLTTGAWTGLGPVIEKDLAFTLTSNKPETGNGMVNITPSDGYLMLPPQTLTGDSKKLEIVYRYTSGSDTAEHTGTHLLSDITGGAWAAGQKVHYIIQLKAKFALELSPASATVMYTAGSYTFGYTTGSSASIDPQVSCPEANGGWISNLKPNRSTGKGTISFNYATNSSETADRKVTITVTSGFTTKDFVFTQTKVPGVLIAGTVWTKTNLTGNASTNGGHRLEANPQDKGMFFRWGTTFVYGRASSSSEGEGFASGQYTRGAATNPTSSQTSHIGYDYDYISGGSSYVGDPCKKLGASYRTPTRAQWEALYTGSSRNWTTYQGMQGYFFGPSASSCNNTTIQPGCIFLPASGSRRFDTGMQDYQGRSCFYWSSSGTGDYGYHCVFGGGDNPASASVRSNGFSVRCVLQ